MVKAYSADLRKRAIQYKEQGGSHSECCRIFSISKATLYVWIKQYQQDGRLSPPKLVRGQRKIDFAKLREVVANNPDLILKEYAKIFNVSIKGIWSALKRAGLTLKKRQYIKKATKLNVKNSLK